MDYSVFLDSRLLILVAALVFIGSVLKGMQKLPDELIPVILTVLGVVMAGFLLGGFTAEAMLQGIISAAAAVYGNQLVKQTKKIGAKIEDKVNDTVD